MMVFTLISLWRVSKSPSRKDYQTTVSVKNKKPHTSSSHPSNPDLNPNRWIVMEKSKPDAMHILHLKCSVENIPRKAFKILLMSCFLSFIRIYSSKSCTWLKRYCYLLEERKRRDLCKNMQKWFIHFFPDPYFCTLAQRTDSRALLEVRLELDTKLKTS